MLLRGGQPSVLFKRTVQRLRIQKPQKRTARIREPDFEELLRHRRLRIIDRSDEPLERRHDAFVPLADDRIYRSHAKNAMILSQYFHAR